MIHTIVSYQYRFKTLINESTINGILDKIFEEIDSLPSHAKFDFEIFSKCVDMADNNALRKKNIFFKVR